MVSKRKGTKNIRLSIKMDGVIRVSLPTWMPYSAAELYVLSKKDWIVANRKPQVADQIIENGCLIGKAHRVVYLATESGKISSRISHTKITIHVPRSLSYSDPVVQSSVRKACIRALKQESEKLLQYRLTTLAEQHSFNYRSMSVKQLKTRWGSCDSRQNICFNLFLIQLPWPQIDYVIMHELQHTVMMHHKPEFWQSLARYVPDLAEMRKTVRQAQPVLKPRNLVQY